jgi:hypothetical protein
MPESDDSGSDCPKDYRRKSDVEKYVADPLRALAHALERYVDAVATNRDNQAVDEQRRETAQERRHRENLAAEGWAATWAAIISGATLLVLIGTLCIYNRQASIMATQAEISKTQAGIARDQLKFANSADLSVMPMRVNPPCQLQWLITNNGNAKAEHLEIFSGVKNLPHMSKLEFSLLDSSKALAEIKQQAVNWAMLLKSHQKEMETMRSNKVTEDRIEEFDKKWRATLPGLPRRVTMELPRNGEIPYGATVCEIGVADATNAPFVNVLLYSYEDAFGTHTGETCVSYFPGPADKGLQPLYPCTEPVPTE